MRRELEEKLYAIEPKWFDRERGAMAFGFEHEDGWFDLVHGLLKLAVERRAAWSGEPDRNPFSPDRFQVRQVKQKLGGLRFYINSTGGDNAFREAIDEAQAASFKVCERCGAKGTVEKNKRGAIRTLCAPHRADDELPRAR